MPSAKNRKGHKLSILLSGIGVFILGLIVWQFYKYRIVNRQVNKAVAVKTKGLYSIRYEGLVIDEVGGRLHVTNIKIIPDTAVYNQLVKEKKNPSTLIKLTIPALDISGIKTPRALLNKEIEGGKVEIRDPVIEILVSPFKKDSTVYDPATDLAGELLGKLLKIKIDSIVLVHAKVIVRNIPEQDNKPPNEPLFSANNVSCLLSDLLIDSVSGKDTSRILFSSSLEMEGEEMLLPLRNKKYELQIGHLRFTSQDNSVYIGQVKLIPRLSEEDFARSFPVQKDRYHFSLEGISLRHIDRAALWHKQLEADSLVIRESSFKIYRDLSQPRDTISRVGKYPWQQLMRLPIPVNIKKVLFVHSFVEYKEKNAKSDSAGKVQFFDAGATITHVTNMRSTISRNNECVLSFRAKFLNKAPVDVRLVMLLRDPQGKFNMEGTIGAIDVSSLNGLTQPMGLARMEKGHIDQLHFNLTGSDSSSEGKVLLLYNGIKVSLLKKDREKNKYDKKGLASLLTGVILKKSNPESGRDARVAEVHFRRILNKSFFNLIWKTIFTGVKENVGIK